MKVQFIKAGFGSLLALVTMLYAGPPCSHCAQIHYLIVDPFSVTIISLSVYLLCSSLHQLLKRTNQIELDKRNVGAIAYLSHPHFQTLADPIYLNDYYYLEHVGVIS